MEIPCVVKSGDIFQSKSASINLLNNTECGRLAA
jgi:hypothetical protein